MSIVLSSREKTFRLPWLPERGAISLLELALFALSVAPIVLGLPPNLQDVVILTYLWAALALAWNIAGGYAGLGTRPSSASAPIRRRSFSCGEG
jgi:branched-chain amino acid transport system permease protein